MRSLPIALLLLSAVLIGVGLLWFRSQRPAEQLPAAATSTTPGVVAETAVEAAPSRGVVEVPAPEAMGRRALRGRVSTVDGSPIAAAEVRLVRVRAPWPEERDESVARVLSGQDGRFQFESENDVELALVATAPGFAKTRVMAPSGLDMVRIRMEPGFDVDGVVVGQDLRPLPDCTVALEPGPWSGRRAEVTRTDGDGRFRFRDIPAGETGVVRISARYAPSQPAGVSSYPVGSREPVRIQILPSPGLALQGRVVRAGTGKAVDGAMVRIYPSTAWNARLHVPFEAVTDADGRYQVSGLSLGNALIEVTHPELSATTRVVTIGRGVPKQSFEMVRRSSLELRLSGDVATGMQIVAASSAGEVGRARADADGVVRFDERFSVGPVTLEVVGGDRVFARSSGRDLSVAVEDGGATALDLEIAPTARLRGRVIDLDGAPISQVLVSTPRFRFEPRNPERWYVQSDDEGRFELRGLPAGSAPLRFEHPDFAPFEQDVPVPRPGATTESDFAMPRPGLIRGRVLRGGMPLAGVTVLAGRDRNATMNAVSDVNGSFELRVAPGRYRILARYSSLPVQVSERIIQVVGGQVVDDVGIEFPRGRQLRGVVYGAETLPVPDAFVFVAGLPGALSTTDQNGRFDLEVPDGEVELQVFSPNFQIQVRESIGANAKDAVVRLPWIADGTITGTIVAQSGSRPLSEAILRLTPLDETAEWDENVRRQRYVASHALTLTGGRFVFDRAPVGRSRLEIVAPGYAPFSQDIDLRRNSTVDLDIVRLGTGAELQGEVHTEDGTPIAGAFVLLGLDDDVQHEFARRTMTDAGGRFLVSGVSPDSRRLLVVAVGYASRAVTLEFPQDLLRTDPLPVVLKRPSTLTLRIVRNGQPVPEYHWISLSLDGRLNSVRGTDAEGVFVSPIERAGTYTIALFGREQDGSIDVEFGDAVEQREVKLEIR